MAMLITILLTNLLCTLAIGYWLAVILGVFRAPEIEVEVRDVPPAEIQVVDVDGQRVVRHVPVRMSGERLDQDQPATRAELNLLLNKLENLEDRYRRLLEVSNTQWEAIAENQRGRVQAARRLDQLEGRAAP